MFLNEQKISSNRVFAGKLLNLRVDTIEFSQGKYAFREIVEHNPASVVVPIDDENNVLLVRQFRYAVGHNLLEAPAGIVENGESPKECAQRELQEEIGYYARDLIPLGKFWSAPGFCNELMYAYLGRALEEKVLMSDPDENISVERIKFSGIAELIRTGEIQDAKTIAALLMAKQFNF